MGGSGDAENPGDASVLGSRSASGEAGAQARPLCGGSGGASDAAGPGGRGARGRTVGGVCWARLGRRRPGRRGWRASLLRAAPQHTLRSRAPRVAGSVATGRRTGGGEGPCQFSQGRAAACARAVRTTYGAGDARSTLDWSVGKPEPACWFCARAGAAPKARVGKERQWAPRPTGTQRPHAAAPGRDAASVWRLGCRGGASAAHPGLQTLRALLIQAVREWIRLHAHHRAAAQRDGHGAGGRRVNGSQAAGARLHATREGRRRRELETDRCCPRELTSSRAREGLSVASYGLRPPAAERYVTTWADERLRSDTSLSTGVPSVCRLRCCRRQRHLPRRRGGPRLVGPPASSPRLPQPHARSGSRQGKVCRQRRPREL